MTPKAASRCELQLVNCFSHSPLGGVGIRQMQGLSWFGFAIRAGVVVVVVIDLLVTLDTIGLEESDGGVDDGVEDVLLTSGSVVSSTTFVVSLNLIVESVEPTSVILINRSCS